MTVLSDYIDDLFGAIRIAGTKVGIGSQAAAEGEPPALSNSKLRVQSVEFTIPLAINSIMMGPQGNDIAKFGAWLLEHTREEIARLFKSERIATVLHDRLQRTIEESSLKAQALLLQEEVEMNQVLLDYAQSVLAVAWDEYQNTGRKGKDRAQRHTNSEMEARFELFTAQLVARLKQQHGAKADFDVRREIQITVEAQKLRELPIHTLTYIKLLITGDGAELQQLACTGGI